jgi:cardiolipin synthase A/B
MASLLDHPWWLLLLASVGITAICAVSITLFSGVGDRPDEARMVGDCGVESEDFLRAIAGTLNAPLSRGGTAKLLNNGDEFYPALYQSLREAKQAINFMVYIWEPGKVSDEMFSILIERARAGVQVRVMVDGLGGHKAHDENIAMLRDVGGQWAWFHPARFGMLTRLHKRNHRRAIIIDGEVGYTGGAAVMDKWMGDGLCEDCWRDCMVEVRGRLAANLQPAFTTLWTHVTGELLVGPAFYGDAEEGGEEGSGEPISRHVSVVSSPSGEAHPMRALFWLSFRAAREHIYITNPYFVPDAIMCALLIERARAGVDVRVLVPGEKIDIALIRWASRSEYESMLEAGMRIYEFQPAMIHQKSAVVDGKWSLVGSANMDVRSKELNQENTLGILDEGFARQLTETFFADLEHAREIDLEEFRRRPLRQRVAEQIAQMFEEQF